MAHDGSGTDRPKPMDEVPRTGTSLVMFDAFRAGDNASAEALFVRYSAVELTRVADFPSIGFACGSGGVVMSVYRSFFVDARSADVTAAGTILGTLRVMAPEQLEAKEADARTDIFALGAIV